MSNSVILPSMTDQMVLAAFKHLVDCELRKKIPGQAEFWFGNQEGLVAGLIMMFGEGDDTRVEKAYSAGLGWLQLIEKVTREGLEDWADALAALDQGDEVDFEAMQEAVDRVVNEYALQHPKRVSDALRNL